MTEKWLTVPEAAARAGVSATTIWRHLDAGRLTRYRRGGRRVYIAAAELDRLFAFRPVAQGA